MPSSKVCVEVHRRRLFFAALRPSAAALVLAISGSASGAVPPERFLAREVPLPGLDSASGAPLRIASAAVDPAGRGFLVVDRKAEGLFLLPWKGPVEKLEAFSASAAGSGPLFRVYARAGRVSLLYWGNQGAALFTPTGALLRRISARAVAPLSDLLVLDELAFSVGTPIVAKLGEKPDWDDARWRRERVRTDCRLYLVDLTASELRHLPLYCRDTIDSPTGRILRSGAFTATADGQRVYVVLEAVPSLLVFDRAGRLLADVPYLEPGETFPRFSADDEKAQLQSHEAPLALRSRFAWSVGLLRWKDRVAVVFRLWDESKRQSRFVADVFDLDGKKLANDVDLGLPPGDFWTFHNFLSGDDGRTWALRIDRSGTRTEEVAAQRLFEILPPAKAASEPAPEPAAGPSFLLRDLVSGEPVTKVQWTFDVGTRTVTDVADSPDGRFTLPALTAGGPALLRLDAGGYLPLELVADPTAAQDLGTLLLDPGRVIEGAVFDARTGEPAAGAEVSSLRQHPWGAMVAEAFGELNRAPVGADGRFKLTGLAEDDLCLRISTTSGEQRAVHLETLENTLVRDLGSLFVGEQVSAAGRVVDPEGLGLVGLEVELRAGNLRDPCLRLTTTAGEDGSFEWRAVAPGRYWLAVRKDQQVVAAKEVELAAPGPVELGPVLVALVTVQGRLTRDGEPVAGGSVVVAAGGAQGRVPPVFLARPGEVKQQVLSDVGTVLGAAVGDDGRFETRGLLPAGDVSVSYTAPGGTTIRRSFALAATGGLEIEWDLAAETTSPSS